MSRLALLAAFTATLAFAQAEKSKDSVANCDIVDQELAQSRGKLSDKERMESIERVYKDMRKLEGLRAKRNEYPAQFIDRCLQLKARIFNSHKEQGSQMLLASYEFNLIAGKVHDLVHVPSVAYAYYEKAIKADPHSADAHWRAYNAWMADQSKRIESGLAKNYGEAERMNFVKLSQVHLDAVLKNPDASVEWKIAALRSRAHFFDRIALVSEAYKDWQNLVGFDSQNVEALGRMAAFEIQSKRWAEARKSLVKLALIVPKNPKVREQLVYIDLKQGDPSSALVNANRALKLFKDHLPLKIYRIQALVDLGRFKEAHEGLQDPQVIGAHDEEKITVEARVYQELGIEALKADDNKKGLAYFDKSLELKSDNPSLRIKGSQEIYHAVRRQKNSPTRLGDLRKIVDYLGPIVENSEVDSTTLEIQIDAAMQSAQANMAARACDALSKAHRFPSTVDALLQCHKAYRASGRTQDDTDYLERALVEPRFRGERGRISGEMGE